MGQGIVESGGCLEAQTRHPSLAHPFPTGSRVSFHSLIFSTLVALYLRMTKKSPPGEQELEWKLADAKIPAREKVGTKWVPGMRPSVHAPLPLPVQVWTLVGRQQGSVGEPVQLKGRMGTETNELTPLLGVAFLSSLEHEVNSTESLKRLPALLFQKPFRQLFSLPHNRARKGLRLPFSPSHSRTQVREGKVLSGCSQTA